METVFIVLVSNLSLACENDIDLKIFNCALWERQQTNIFEIFNAKVVYS